MNAATCANCGAAQSGPYCPQCGQRAAHPDPTIREFLHESSEELFHWEGKIPRTAKALLFQPGVLTLDFLAGRRARWLPPLRVYLLCSVAFFLSGTLSEHFANRPLMNASVTLANHGQPTVLTPDLREQIAKSLPARILGADRLIQAAESGRDFGPEVRKNLPKAMFVLVPVFAIFTWLLWRRHFTRYPSHLYVALHLHAAWFLVVATITVAAIPFSDAVAAALGGVMTVYVVGYTLVALRRVFKSGWPATLAKSVVLLVLYSLSVVAVSLSLLIYALLKAAPSH